MSAKSSNSPDSPLKPLTPCNFTPPQYCKTRNPFERAVIDNLHRPICSPNMFSLPIKNDTNVQFEWDIHQVAIIKPVDIDDSAGQSDPSPDPIFEKKANTVIKRFFSQGILPSPMDQPLRNVALVNAQGRKSPPHLTEIKKREVCTQTVLTLPPVLPNELEVLLKPYFTYNLNESSCEIDHSNVSAYGRQLFWFTAAKNEEDQLFQRTVEPLVQPKTVILQGMERTFGTPISSVSSKQKIGKTTKHESLEQTPDPGYSPILYEKCSDSDNISEQLSYNFSPIKFDDGQSIKSVEMKTCKEFNFDGLTPEKSVVITYHASLSPMRLKQKALASGLREARPLKGESTILNRSKKLDFSMDISVDVSMTSNLDRSLRSLSVPGIPSASCHSSPLGQHESWIMDLSNSGQDLSKKPDHVLNHLEYNCLKPADRELVSNDNRFISAAKLDDYHHAIKDTPIKGKAKNVLLLDKVFDRVFQEKKSFNRNMESPMQMSFDNSFDDNFENLPDSNLDVKSDISNLITSKINTEPNISQLGANYTASKKACDASESYKRMDSGLGNETSYFGKSSYLDNLTRQSAELTYADLTKSHCNIDLTKSSCEDWRRKDSGFTDEASRDNFHCFLSGNCIKKKTFTPIDFSNEKKENFNCNRESLSMSDIFADEIIKCNFSSTPSKNKIPKN